jgi:hypothetical protein
VAALLIGHFALLLHQTCHSANQFHSSFILIQSREREERERERKSQGEKYFVKGIFFAQKRGGKSFFFFFIFSSTFSLSLQRWKLKKFLLALS